ncbi:MAG: hypothetical protein V1838_03830 [Patescibacteria group bacterium]
MSEKSAKNNWWSREITKLLIIITLATALFSFFQATDTFADPDSFYHAKMAVLIDQGGVVRDFPWAHFTILADNYADQHFLYHLLLVPFVKFFDPLVGIKIATVMLAVLLMGAFYYVLRSLKVRWPLLFTLLLLTINPLTFRLSLAKATSVSIILLLIGLSLIANYRWRWLAVISFLYVWLYGGFSLLFVVATTYIVVSWLVNRYRHRQSSHRYLQKVFSLLGTAFTNRRKRRLNLHLWLSVVIGIIAGIVINPYWPKNLVIYLHQLINIGIINYRNVIGVGGEWYPYGFIELVTNTVVVNILVVIALALFVIYFRKQSKMSITTALLWLFFLVLTLKSRRYVEYYVPFAMLFSAISLTDSLRDWPWPRFWKEFVKVWRHNILTKALSVILAAFVIIGLPYVIGRDIITERKDHENGFPLSVYQKGSQWLANNSPAGSIVLHDDWDEFPVLFYHNSHNYYIVGLDPTFMYLYDEDKYWQWVDITTGQYKKQTAKVIRESFNAKYIFVATDHQAMDRLITSQTDFPLVYEDNEVRIYQVTEP